MPTASVAAITTTADENVPMNNLIFVFYTFTKNQINYEQLYAFGVQISQEIMSNKL